MHRAPRTASGFECIDIKASTSLCYDVMRTTLTLDKDVAAQLERLRRERDVPFKQVVNEALRQGLLHLSSARPARKRFRTRSVSLGRCLIGSLDDVAEALDVAEGENLR